MSNVRARGLSLHRILKSHWTYAAIRVLGFGLLVGYVALSGDWRLSVAWALVVPAISFSIAWLFVGLKLFHRFPKLNRYALYTDAGPTTALSENEWALRQAEYLESVFRGKAILFTPAEDGLVCVPVLLVGIGPISASFGGVAFALIHLERFTYLECIGKGVIYALVCYLVLPYGLLTVALGHLAMDALGLVAIKVGKHRLSRSVASDSQRKVE